MGGHWNEAPIKEGMFLGGYVSFALRGKFSQLDFNQFNFCRQRLCMGDLFFEQGIGLFFYIVPSRLEKNIRFDFDDELKIRDQNITMLKNELFLSNRWFKKGDRVTKSSFSYFY